MHKGVYCIIIEKKKTKTENNLNAPKQGNG